MKKITLVLLLIFSFFNENLQAQEVEKRIDTKNNIKFTGLRAGLFLDNGLHPGLKLGTSYFLKEKVKSKKRRSEKSQEKYGNKTKQIKYLADGHIGFYNHPNNHTGVFLGFGFSRFRTKKRINRRGKERIRTFGWSFEVNYLRRFYNIETFKLGENGEVQKVHGAGNNSLMFVISPILGKTYGIKNGGDGFYIYVKPSLQVLKYNHTFVPNAAIELGVDLNLFKRKKTY